MLCYVMLHSPVIIYFQV